MAVTGMTRGSTPQLPESPESHSIRRWPGHVHWWQEHWGSEPLIVQVLFIHLIRNPLESLIMFHYLELSVNNPNRKHTPMAHSRYFCKTSLGVARQGVRGVRWPCPTFPHLRMARNRYVSNRCSLRPHRWRRVAFLSRVASRVYL